MTEYDWLLGWMFALPPLLVAVLIFMADHGTNLVVAIKTKTVCSGMLRNPAIIVGDGVLLPAVGALMALFYQSVETPAPLTQSAWWMAGTIPLALAATIVSRIRYSTLSAWYIPHGVYYFFMGYALLNFIPKGAIQLLSMESTHLWLLWAGAIILFAAFWPMGLIWPKKFPL